MFKIDQKGIVDSTGKSESEICSGQDPIFYHFCQINGCNCQWHDGNLLWDFVLMATLHKYCRLRYWPTSWFWLIFTTYCPPSATCYPLSATCYWLYATCWLLNTAFLTTPVSHYPVLYACIWATFKMQYWEVYRRAYSQVRLEVS